MSFSQLSALPSLPVEVFQHIPTLGKIIATGQVMYSQNIYIPAEVNKLYIQAVQEKCSLRFSVGGLFSPLNAEVEGPIWADELSIDVSSISGVHLLCIQAYTSEIEPTGGISGITSRWE